MEARYQLRQSPSRRGRLRWLSPEEPRDTSASPGESRNSCQVRGRRGGVVRLGQRLRAQTIHGRRAPGPAVEDWDTDPADVIAWREERGDRHGNFVRVDGCDRCACGCKYWENDRCIDCGEALPEA